MGGASQPVGGASQPVGGASACGGVSQHVRGASRHMGEGFQHVGGASWYVGGASWPVGGPLGPWEAPLPPAEAHLAPVGQRRFVSFPTWTAGAGGVTAGEDRSGGGRRDTFRRERPLIGLYDRGRGFSHGEISTDEETEKNVNVSDFLDPLK